MTDEIEAASQIAQRMCGDRIPPSWVPTAIKLTINRVRDRIQMAEKWGTRESQRGLLEELRNEIASVLAKLDDTEIAVLLLTPDTGTASISNTDFLDRQFRENLECMIQRVDDARAQIPPPGKGLRKHNANPGNISPREIVALNVSLIWIEIFCEPAPITNALAHRICMDIWALTGGPTGHSGKDWATHIRSIKPLLSMSTPGDRVIKFIEAAKKTAAH